MTATIEDVAEDVTAPEYVQPADVIDAESTGEIELFAAGFGALSIKPDQSDFTAPQRAALAAIGVDLKNDPGVEPHIVPFLHLCQSRGLDPWKREAYLIGRGRDGDRKWVMQVGIDGYLNMAKGTGRYSRVSDRLWAGSGDKPEDWYVDGNGVRRRVYVDSWETEWGTPAHAKAVIEHYDDRGRLTETSAVANWGMYAPYFPKKVWNAQTRRMDKVYDPQTRQPVMELGEFWQKDPSGMLVKCATALAVRLAFPGATAGTYTSEEMHQADAAERIRVEAEQAAARHRAVVDLAARKPVGESSPSEPLGLGDIIARATAAAKPRTGREDVVVDAEVVEEPAAAPEVAQPAEVPAEAAEAAPAAEEQDASQATEAERRGWLLDELAAMAKLSGSTVPALTRRWVATHKRNADDPRTTADELMALVASLRPMVLLLMRRNPQLIAAADVYETVPVNEAWPVAELFGGHLADAL